MVKIKVIQKSVKTLSIQAKISQNIVYTSEGLKHLPKRLSYPIIKGQNE